MSKQSMIYDNIDLSYKQDAIKMYYDIEVLQQVFTLAILSQGEAYLAIAPAKDQALPTVTEMHDSIIKRLDTPSGKRVAGDNPTVTIDVINCDDPLSINRLYEVLNRIIHCNKIDSAQQVFTEYRGWNSARYDLPMLCIANLLCRNSLSNSGLMPFTPQNLRVASNAIISHDGPPWTLLKHVESRLQPNGIANNSLSTLMKAAKFADGHIDLAAIARSQDGEDEARFPPGLKREMARYGLDIVVDELVASDDSRALTEQEMLQLISYNFNDVIGTAYTAFNGVIEHSISTRDIVREMYKFTSAKAGGYRLGERDCTAAELAGLVLTGPNRDKMIDYPVIDYTFPVPDPCNPGSTKQVDLLEYMKETEQFMPDDLYTFFDHFRGQDTRFSYQDWRVKKSQPITHSAKINIPYYRDGKPIDCYIRVSSGGAHGSVMAGLHRYTDEEIANWTRADAGAADHEKPTIDMDNVLHIDWSSFYPVMASKMKLYITADGTDRYTQIINTRISIKNSINHDKSKWTERDYTLFNEEQGLKFILNNATGAGNKHSRYALLDVDNKTLSMRLIGNMHIWCLGQRLAQAGAFIVSTNTDGLFIAGIELEECREVIKEYVDTYGMPVDPEVTERFINRDTSNRIEYAGGKPVTCGGLLRCGLSLKHEDYMVGRTTPMPIVVAHAVMRYMDDRNWLYTPYNRDRLQSLLEGLRDTTTVEPWYHIYVGNASRVLLLDNVKQQKVTRLVLTTSGQTAETLNARKPVKTQIEALLALLKTHPDKTHNDILDMWSKQERLEVASELQDGDMLTVAVKDKFDKHVIADDKGSSHEQWFKEAIDSNALKQGQALCVLKGKDSSAEPLKIWSKGDKLARYPSNIVTSLDTEQSLQEFDMNLLDIKAYTDWAEQVLLSWKRTADIPQLGLTYFDDPNIVKTLKSMTKREKAVATLAEIYNALSL